MEFPEELRSHLTTQELAELGSLRIAGNPAVTGALTAFSVDCDVSDLADTLRRVLSDAFPDAPPTVPDWTAVVPEVLELAFSFLDARSLARTEQVCKTFRACVRDTLWKGLVQELKKERLYLMHRQKADGQTQKEFYVFLLCASPTTDEEYIAWALQLMSEEGGDVLAGMRHLRDVLRKEDDPKIDTAIQMGVVPQVIRAVNRSDDHDLLFEAFWVLTNLAAGEENPVWESLADPLCDATRRVLSRDPPPNLLEQVAWFIGNYAGTSATYRDLMDERGCLDDLLAVLANQTGMSKALYSTVTWAISNFVRTKPLAREMATRVWPVATNALRLKQHPDSEGFADLLWMLSYIIQEAVEGDGDYLVDDVIANPEIITLLARECILDRRIVPAVRCLGNLASGPDRLTLHLAQDPVALERVVALLESTDLSQADRAITSLGTPELLHLRADLAWLVSNVAATPGTLFALTQYNAHRYLVDALDEPFMRIRMEAVHAIRNIMESFDPFPDELRRVLPIFYQKIMAMFDADAVEPGSATDAARIALERLEEFFTGKLRHVN